jgi:hypothetical protein
MCYWSEDAADPTSGECSFRPIQGDFIRVVTVALVSAVASAPLSLSLQYIISNFLTKETSDKEDEDASVVSVRKISRKQTAANQEYLQERCGGTVTEDLQNLTRELLAHRRTISGKDKQIFDGDMFHGFICCHCNCYIVLYCRCLGTGF